MTDKQELPDEGCDYPSRVKRNAAIGLILYLLFYAAIVFLPPERTYSDKIPYTCICPCPCP